VLVDGHEVGHHHQAGARGEDGVEEVGPVSVPLVDVVGLIRVKLPAPALPGIQDPSEDSRIVEPGQAEPVDAPIDPDQRSGAAVADQPVGADRQVPVDALGGGAT